MRSYLRNHSFYSNVNWRRNDSLIHDFHGESLILRRNGVYSVDVVNNEGCWASANASESIKVDEESFVYNISTGADGIIKVENDSNETAVIQVYDLTGRIVFSNKVHPGTNLYHTTRRGLLIFRIEGTNNLKSKIVFVH